MTHDEKVLWQKISSFPLDDDHASFKFSRRLANENGWDDHYTERVIQEYRKFIFLCCVSDTGVTPSDPVDQAWHLHLTFTRSYWIDLCRDTIGKDIHHNPTKGGKAEAEKFNSFYNSSQKLYSDKFGSEPPLDIWQDNHTRFTDIKFQRVNLNKYWIIIKPGISKKQGIVQLNLLVLAVIMFAVSENLIAAAIVVALVGFLIRTVIKQTEEEKERRGGCGGAAGCGDGGADGNSSNGHHSSHHDGGHSFGHHGDGESGCGSANSGCSSGCSGCSSGCSGCGGGGD